MFYDSNNIQLSTKVEEVSTEDIVAKYEAWGWSVISIDGNDPRRNPSWLSPARWTETEKPTLIVGHTLMGKGARRQGGRGFLEQGFHAWTASVGCGRPTSPRRWPALGGDPENPFVIFDDVKELYAASPLRNCKNGYALRREEESSLGALPISEQAAELDLFLSGKTAGDRLPRSINCGDNVATRAASAAVLCVLGRACRRTWSSLRPT